MGRTSDARERLIEAAASLWHSRSFTEVGVNDICDEAGVRKGSFYHFFSSKSELALAVIDHQWNRYGVLIQSKVGADLPPLERITRLVEVQREILAPAAAAGHGVHGCPFGNLAAELSTQDEVLRARLEKVFEQSLVFFEEALTEAVAAGDLPAIDVHETARAMYAYSQGLFLLAKTKNDLDVLRDLGPAILRLAHAAPAVSPPRRRTAA